MDPGLSKGGEGTTIAKGVSFPGGSGGMLPTENFKICVSFNTNFLLVNLIVFVKKKNLQKREGHRFPLDLPMVMRK